ncbi:MAG: methionyl-tRNA formyltransferase [Tissierellia bacterium]|nr:methionyl-tRNA formyltransferase [Tissierellia bacterium]
MKILFFSSTSFGAELLKVILGSKHEIVGVVTRSDKVRKRGNRVEMTPVKKVAMEADQEIPIFELDAITNEDVFGLKETRPDMILVVAYGVILPRNVLEIASKSVNIHASLLPQFRGATPIESAILHGVKETGITYMEMDEGMDTGEIYTSYPVEISSTTNFDTLEFMLLNLAKDSILTVIEDIASEKLQSTPQIGEASYTKKIEKKDTEIDLNKSRVFVMNQINALDSHIGARLFFEGKAIKLFGAALHDVSVAPGHIATLKNGIYVGASDGALQINEIQMPGKRKMKASEFIRGNRLEGIVDGYNKR